MGLKTAQAVAIESAGIHVSGPGATTVSDTSANLQALTAMQISALPGIGVTGLYSNNANVAYSAAQTSAIVSANLTPSAVSTHTVAETFSNGVAVTTAATEFGRQLDAVEHGQRLHDQRRAVRTQRNLGRPNDPSDAACDGINHGDRDHWRYLCIQSGFWR